MNRKKFKRIMVLPILVAVLLVYSGCGKNDDESNPDKSSVSIKKDGTVISTTVEDFTEGYYDVDELREMAENEINAFVVSNGQDSASLKSVDFDDGKVKLVIKFGSSSDYSHFNSETLVYETVSDAILSGQIDVNSLVDKDGNIIDSSKTDSLSNKHVVISASKNLVSTPYKIKYVSGGVQLVDKNTADLSGVADDVTACMVLDK